MEVLNRMVRYFPAENVKGASDRKIKLPARYSAEMFQVGKAPDPARILDVGNRAAPYDQGIAAGDAGCHREGNGLQ